MEKSDPYNLQRFIEAQDNNFETVLNELKNGRKESHWMWWIFPQLKELGFSTNSKFYGLSGIYEAKAYLQNPVLHKRIEACLNAVIESGVQNPVSIFGKTDSLKFQSCLTLFSKVEPQNKLFTETLNVFFQGTTDFDTDRFISNKFSCFIN